MTALTTNSTWNIVTLCLIEYGLASTRLHPHECYWLVNEYANANHTTDCMTMPLWILVVAVRICHCELHYVTKFSSINFIK